MPSRTVKVIKNEVLPIQIMEHGGVTHNINEQTNVQVYRKSSEYGYGSGLTGTALGNEEKLQDKALLQLNTL